MNKTILSFVLGFGIIYILNKKNKDLILHGFLASIVLLLIFKKFLPSFEGLENKNDDKSTTNDKTTIKIEDTSPPTGPPSIPETTAKMPTKDSDADSLTSSPALVPTDFPSGPGINTKTNPSNVQEPTTLDDKKCDLSECQSLWDQKYDQLIPHTELKGNMLALEITPEEREKRYQTQQDVRSLSRLLNVMKEYDSNGSDRMTTSGLEDSTIMSLNGNGISGGKSKDGSIKILNINVIPGAENNSGIDKYLNNSNDNEYKMDTSVDLGKSIGLPQGETMTNSLKKNLNNSLNLSQSNDEQINNGLLDYIIPLTDQKNKPKSPYTYVDPRDWLSTGKKGTWQPYNDGDFSKLNLSNTTENTIEGSMSSTKSLPLASSIGSYFEL